MFFLLLVLLFVSLISSHENEHVRFLVLMLMLMSRLG